MTDFADVRIGCQVKEQVSASYWKDFQVFELSERVLETVKDKTLRKWRNSAPDGAEFVPTFGTKALADGLAEQAESIWNRLQHTSELLGATTVLFRTPSSFRPSDINRKAVHSFMEKRPKSLRCAWWAEGLWGSDPESMDVICQVHDVLRVVDPLGLDDGEELPEGAEVYWRLMGRRGMTGRFTDYEMEQLTDLILSRSRSHVLFTSPSMTGSAKRLVRLVDDERQMAAAESEA